MSKALMLDNRVVQVAAVDFPVAAPLTWIDVPVGQTPNYGDVWDGTQFVTQVPPAPTRWLVPKLLLVDRLIAAGQDDAAFTALGAASAAVQRRWDACVEIWNDDPDALALLNGIGADPSIILAPPS